MSLDDPRPEKYRKMEGYESHVRSVVINFCSKTSMDIPMKYQFRKADVYSVGLDHDHPPRFLPEYWVEEALQVI